MASTGHSFHGTSHDLLFELCNMWRYTKGARYLHLFNLAFSQWIYPWRLFLAGTPINILCSTESSRGKALYCKVGRNNCQERTSNKKPKGNLPPRCFLIAEGYRGQGVPLRKLSLAVHYLWPRSSQLTSLNHSFFICKNTTNCLSQDFCEN